MKTIYIAGAAVGVAGLVYLIMKNSQAANLTPQVAGAPQGPSSSSPSNLYSLFFPQAARADNNPALNNQPYAQKPPTGGGAVAGISGWAGATASVASAFQSIFGSTASDGYSLNVTDAGTQNYGNEEYSDSGLFSADDLSSLDSSYDSSASWMNA